jgi:AraC family transcriptional regulator of adaptative response/methylated-DNA-[protein]-cysteine methyltransferase
LESILWRIGDGVTVKADVIKRRSYKEQAVIIGQPSAVRAVARANGDNRIAIIIPCHRVIGADGKLVGYGGGLWRKQYLLNHEVKNMA